MILVNLVGKGSLESVSHAQLRLVVALDVVGILRGRPFDCFFNSTVVIIVVINVYCRVQLFVSLFIAATHTLHPSVLDVLADLRDTLDFTCVLTTKEAGPGVPQVDHREIWRESSSRLDRGR